MNLFRDVPEEQIETVLKNIRNNLQQLSLYDGHVIKRHVDIQPEVLKNRLLAEEMKYATSYYDMRIAKAVTVGLMQLLYENRIKFWLLSSGSDFLMLRGRCSTGIGYGYQKGDRKLYEDLQQVRVVLEKEESCDWGFRILTSYPTF